MGRTIFVAMEFTIMAFIPWIVAKIDNILHHAFDMRMLEETPIAISKPKGV